MAGRSAGSAVEVAEQADFTAVVHDLTVDVQDQAGHRVGGILGTSGSERRLQASVAKSAGLPESQTPADAPDSTVR